jgi:hypothetical protein
MTNQLTVLPEDLKRETDEFEESQEEIIRKEEKKRAL